MMLSLCIRACYNTQVFTVVPNARSNLCALGSTLNTVRVVACPNALTISVKSLVQLPPHKGDSDKRELLFMGTGLWGQISMHVIFIC